MNIEYENGFLNGKFMKSYIDNKILLKSTDKIDEMKKIIFHALGSFVTLSQIAEYVLSTMIKIKKISNNKGNLLLLQEAFDNALSVFDMNDINLSKEPTLSAVLNNLFQSGLLSKDVYLKSKFITENRNEFVHNYFINKPKCLVDLKQMKIFVLQVLYSSLSLNQLIVNSFEIFNTDVLKKNPSLESYLSKFRDAFIGEFKA